VYFLSTETGSLPDDLRAAMRDWLRTLIPILAIEQPGDLWLLFSDSELYGAVRRHLDRTPGAPQHAYATIWLRDDGVELETVRDPETDQALRAFVIWAQTQASLQLTDSGMPITAADLIDPELYE
jgi:hypothetical protein